MKKRGIAKGSFRADSSRKWNGVKGFDKTGAQRARERMIARENGDSLTDEVVDYYMGGKDGAAKQAKAYEKLMEDIKNGKNMEEEPGGLAEAARKRMLEREKKKHRGKEDEEHPDVGRDRANRQAYPKTERR